MHPTDQVALVTSPRSLREPVKLFAGAAVERTVWIALTPVERRRLVVRARAAALTAEGVVSHRSAAALWGLPDVDRDDGRLHVIDPRRPTTHSGPGVVRHRGVLAASDVTHLHGLAVTALLRSVIDVIRSCSFQHAVAVLDHVLRNGLSTRAELLDALEPHRGRRGATRALQAVAFADPLSDSPGESISRVQVHELRLPTPVLQQPFRTDHGRFRVDFWWPEYGVVGEFDGRVKYDDREALWQEKRREDALRRLPEVQGFARWTMGEAVDAARLASVLGAAGLPVLRSTSGVR